MARRRKDNNSDAEYYKTLQYLEKSAEEEIRLAKAAAEAMPTTEEMQAAQQAAELMKQAPTAQELQQASEAQELLNLSFSEIELLPEAKQELIYQEMGRQLAEMPGFIDGLESLARMLDAFQLKFDNSIFAAKELTKPLDMHKLHEFDKFRRIIRIPDEMLSRMKDYNEWYPILQPYIDEEYKSDPQKYATADMRDLLAAATSRARADGKQIPVLWYEQEEIDTTQGEQLEMQLDLPGANKEKSAASESPAALIEAIKKMPVLNPQAHVMPNNALMNVMQKQGAINEGAFDLPVLPARGRQKKEITTYTMIDYTPDESGITITDPKLSEYERQVSDAVVCLWVEAERQGVEPVFTADAVYSAMPGGGDTASPQQKGAIAKAIEKFRRIHMTVDATEELRRRGTISEKETVKFDEYYFQITRARRTSKHSSQSVTAYRLTEKPVILKYAEMTKQILTVQPKYLTIRKVKGDLITTELITMNADRQAMTGYMMRRIAVMKHDTEAARDRLKSYEKKRKQHPELELEEKPLEAFRQQSNTILFDTIFSQAEISTTDRKQLMLYRNFCYDVLEYWKATAFIKGYTEQSKGRKITGIDIEI